MNKSKCLLVFAFSILFQACSSGGNDHQAKTSSSSSSSANTAPEWFPSGIVDELPKLRISTNDNLPIISKNEYITGQFELEDESSTIVSGDMEIRGRGNSTWQWPKKPYRIKLAASTAILDMPASKHWILLANYADKTLMRNDLAFTLSGLMGFEYTVKHRYVELYINEQYDGVYQITEQIRLAQNRIDIEELKGTDEELTDTTGGYLIELDFRMATNFCINDADGTNVANSETCLDGVNLERADTFCVESAHGMSPMCLKDPDDLQDPLKVGQKDYIGNYLAEMETALFSTDFADPILGYGAYLDVDSVVNYYLINEFFKNVDGGSTSFFMYKKRDGKLFFGPIWDFDLAMGSNYFVEGQNPIGWATRTAPWFTRLFEDPAFVAKVKSKWADMKENDFFALLLQYGSHRAQWLSVKQQENFDRWPLTGTLELWLADYSAFNVEVNQLLDWQRTRYGWMDQQLKQ